jgi:hypothetical protein
MKLKIFLSLLLTLTLISPTQVYALSWDVRDGSENIINVSGSCTGHTVTIHLFSDISHPPVYSSGTTCLNKSFSFTDNLNQWKIPEGEYDLLISEDQKRPKTSKSAKIKVKKEQAQITTLANPPTINSLDQSLNKFSENLTNLTESVNDVSKAVESLEEPKKKEVNLILTSIQGVLTTLNDLYIKLIQYINKPIEPLLNASVPESSTSATLDVAPSPTQTATASATIHPSPSLDPEK